MQVTPRDVDPEAGVALMSQADVVSVLRTLVGWQVPMTLRISGVVDPVESTLLSVKPQFAELVFDAQALPAQYTLEPPYILEASAVLDNYHISFTALHVEAVRGRNAIRAQIPAAVGRVQRRGAERFATPSVNPPVCHGRFAGASGIESMRLVDISLTGLSVIVDDPDVELRLPDMLYDCRIELPGFGTIAADVEVTHARDMGDTGWRRLGCRFVGLPITALSIVRRYVDMLTSRSETMPQTHVDRRSTDRRCRAAVECRRKGAIPTPERQ